MGSELTQFKKNFTPWNKGIKGKASHSFGNKHALGKKYALGIKHTPEQNKAKSERMKGHPGYTKGFKFSVEARKKMSESHRGNKSYRWLGGITELGDSIRQSYKYRLWRCDVFTRDGYTCQECGRTGGELNTDHITPFAVVLKKNEIMTVEQALECEELWNINNGRTLCIPCHKKTESYMNPRYNFKPQQQLSPAIVAAGQNTKPNVSNIQQNGR